MAVTRSVGRPRTRGWQVSRNRVDCKDLAENADPEINRIFSSIVSCSKKPELNVVISAYARLAVLASGAPDAAEGLREVRFCTDAIKDCMMHLDKMKTQEATISALERHNEELSIAYHRLTSAQETKK